jgi:biotin carboxylase
MAGKTLLIVSAGAEAVFAVQRAQEMGHKVLVSDRNPSAPGFSAAGEGLEASTYDAEATADAAEHYVRQMGPIHGVLTVAADVPLTVATVAARLGLPGIPLEAARLAQDKLAMKHRFAAMGVPIPWFSAAASPQELEAFVRAKGDRLVVKPVDSRGSRGVQRLWLTESPRHAWEAAAQHSPTGRVMVEAYLEGPQVSTEGFLLDGIGHIPGFSDRNYELLDLYAPYFVENGGDLPSALPPDSQATLKAVTANAGRALGIRTGNIKGDMVWSGGKPYVIELAARASGGYFCTHEIPLNTGVDFVGALIRMALGEPIPAEDLKPRFQRAVTQRYAFAPPGRVVAIEGVAEARAVPGVAECLVSAKIGDVIPEPRHAGAAAAMVIATADGPAQARARADAAIQALKVETVPQ